jgi:hypothetical protein
MTFELNQEHREFSMQQNAERKKKKERQEEAG